MYIDSVFHEASDSVIIPQRFADGSFKNEIMPSTYYFFISGSHYGNGTTDKVIEKFKSHLEFIGSLKKESDSGSIFDTHVPSQHLLRSNVPSNTRYAIRGNLQLINAYREAVLANACRIDTHWAHKLLVFDYKNYPAQYSADYSQLSSSIIDLFPGHAQFSAGYTCGFDYMKIMLTQDRYDNFCDNLFMHFDIVSGFKAFDNIDVTKITVPTKALYNIAHNFFRRHVEKQFRQDERAQQLEYLSSKMWQNCEQINIYQPQGQAQSTALIDKYLLNEDRLFLPNVGYLDIEADFDQEKGYAPVDDPFNKITSVAIHASHLNETVCLALVPQNEYITDELLEKIIEKFGDRIELFTDEREMLSRFVDRIIDCDILTGWNSERYDIPYIVNRMYLLGMNKDIKRLSRFGMHPTVRTFTRFDNEYTTYDLRGRIHLDYLNVYKKFTFGEKVSYKLDYIAELELKKKKVAYDGTLDDLYNKDFLKFIDYNIQDVDLLVELEEKKKLLMLVVSLSHNFATHCPEALGTVAIMQNALLKEIKLNKGEAIVGPGDFRRQQSTYEAEVYKMPGAFVADPIKGKHKNVGSCDFASLYPSIIRMLNAASPETFMFSVVPERSYAEIKSKLYPTDPRLKAISSAEAWAPFIGTHEYLEVMNQTDTIVTVDFASYLTGYNRDDLFIKMPAKEVYKIIKDNNLSFSGYGVAYRTDIKGYVNYSLEKWYGERKQLKGLMFFGEKVLADGLTVKFDNTETTNLESASTDYLSYNAMPEVFEKAFTEDIKKYIGKNNLFELKENVKDGDKTVNKIYINKEHKYFDDLKKYVKATTDYYDMMQLLKKILLNSVYGMLGSKYCNIYDNRQIGSTTLSGKIMTYSLAKRINDCCYIQADKLHLAREDEIICDKRQFDNENDAMKYFPTYGKLVTADYSCALYSDTDSVTGDAVVNTSRGDMSIEELFKKSTNKWNPETEPEKEFGMIDRLSVRASKSTEYLPANYVYRHKVSKSLFKITTESGNEVTVTEDHSVMVLDENGGLIEIKGSDIEPGMEVLEIVK